MLKDIWEKRFDGLQYTGARAPLYWSPFLSKNMFFVFFSDMNHGELKVPSPIGRPSRDTQNLVLSELSLIIPFQNIENKFLGLQYIGAPKFYFQYSGKEWGEKVMTKPGFVCHMRVYKMD